MTRPAADAAARPTRGNRRAHILDVWCDSIHSRGACSRCDADADGRIQLFPAALLRNLLARSRAPQPGGMIRRSNSTSSCAGLVDQHRGRCLIGMVPSDDKRTEPRANRQGGGGLRFVTDPSLRSTVRRRARDRQLDIRSGSRGADGRDGSRGSTPTVDLIGVDPRPPAAVILDPLLGRLPRRQPIDLRLHRGTRLARELLVVILGIRV